MGTRRQKIDKLSRDHRAVGWHLSSAFLYLHCRLFHRTGNISRNRSTVIPMKNSVTFNEPSECPGFQCREGNNFPWPNYWRCPPEAIPRNRLHRYRWQWDNRWRTFSSIRLATSSNSQNTRLLNVKTGGTPIEERIECTSARWTRRDCTIRWHFCRISHVLNVQRRNTHFA